MSQSNLRDCLALCREALADSTPNQFQLLEQLEARLASLTTQHHGGIPIETNVLQQLREAIVVMDLAGYITLWNSAAEQLFGYTAEEAIGQHVLFLYAQEDDEEDKMPELFLDNGNAFFEVRRRKKSGEVFWAGLSLTTLYDNTQEPIALVAHLTEITAQRQTEAQLRLQASVIDNSEQGIMITDTNECIVFVNSAFTRITGYSVEEALGKTPDLLRSGVHSADFRAEVHAALVGANPWQGEIIGKRKNGELFPQSVSISAVRTETGNVSHVFSVFTDISVLRATEERMKQMASHDALTDLPNRTLLNQLLKQALIESKRAHTHGAVLAIDLYRFTSINDTLGHEVGDELLRQVAVRLRQTLRAEDVLARAGGDEFIAALLDIKKREHSAIVAEKILSALNTPFEIEGNTLHISASIGIAVYPADDTDANNLLQFADVAMKRLQKNGEIGYRFYSPEMNQRAKEQLRLESELRAAPAAGELLLYYQPKVSLRSGHIVGSEALIRWKHTTRGMVSPGEFIPLAEETGLILDIGNWALVEACRQIRAWQAAGLQPPPVAVNLSARQFDAQLPHRIQQILDDYQIEPRLLRLEITESLLVRGADVVIPIMNQLVAMGLALALDDFGTGYSSLAYLKKFPISTLKIDRSFVIGIPGDDNDCAIARAIVTMAQQLRQEIVAEGVETDEQMHFLRDLGCDQLQGYLFSPPVQAEKFAEMLLNDRCLPLPH